MTLGIDEAPVNIAVDMHGRQPSLRVAGNADLPNMLSVVEVLDRLADEHEACVSLDLGEVESMDAGALQCLARRAGSLKDRRKRLHLKRVSSVVDSLLDKHLISDLFCREEHTRECTPGSCGIAEKNWDLDVFVMPATMAYCGKARARVDQVAQAVGFSRCRRSDIMLAVGEAVANAVKHGSSEDGRGYFTIYCLATPERLQITVSDCGSGFDPSALPSLEEALIVESGRGIHCMEAVMDEVDFHFEAGTTVRMVKYG